MYEFPHDLSNGLENDGVLGKTPKLNARIF